MAVAAAETVSEAGPEAGGGITCVVDLGEHSRKRIKRLRRGEGRLMLKVEELVEDLQEQGVISATAQTVVVVVREEFSIKGLLDDDDDD